MWGTSEREVTRGTRGVKSESRVPSPESRCPKNQLPYALRDVHNLPIRIDAHLMLHAAHTAGLRDVPRLTQLRAPGLRCRTHDDFLVTVFPAVLAGVALGDPLRPLLRDHFVPSPPDESAGGLGVVDGAAEPTAPPTALRSNSRIPPTAPSNPAASDGKKIVDPFPCA